MSSTAVQQNLPILTVSQVTNAIKMCLESAFPTVWLQGEISNCKLHTSGHLYFSLKDASAQIGAVMYRADAQGLKAPPKDGAQVIIRGELNVYPPSGKYQLIVKELRPVGVGELLQRLEELKQALHKKGYFKQTRKKTLPKLPHRIGVVTSPTGAAIQDILNILTRRFSGFHLILNPVKVQGEGSAKEIAQAIDQFNQYDLVDVMIVGRGGGSIEDLWAFNEEIVADAIYNSRIPVISAVGHETDHCIADYVADVRAPTPSAAAEIVISEKAQQLKLISQLIQRLHQTMKHILRNQERRLEGIRRHPVLQSPYGILGPWMQKLDDLRQGIDLSMQQRMIRYRIRVDGCRRQIQSLKPSAQIRHLRQKLVYVEKGMAAAFDSKIQGLRTRLLQIRSGIDLAWSAQQNNRRGYFQADVKRKLLDGMMAMRLERHHERLEALQEALAAVNPKKLLAKGYSILFSEIDHSVITSVHALHEGQAVRVLLADGEATAIIN